MKTPAVGDERVAILAPSGRDAVLARRALADAGMHSVVCTSVDKLFDVLRAGAGTALIAVEALTEPDISRLADILATQPEWSDFGLVLLARADMNGLSRDRLVRRLSVLPNCALLERPLRASTLVSTIETMLRSRRRQYELRSHLIERERLRRELQEQYGRQTRIAETLQLSLLSPPRERIHAKVETATIYRAASQEADVGGDFYDQFLIDQNRVALVVGDVSGKGLQAAARTMEVKYPLRAFLRESGSPADALSRLNAFLIRAQTLDAIADAGFICLFASVVDVGSRTVSFANAGMEPPMIVEARGGSRDLVGAAPPLGVDARMNPTDRQCVLGCGETLLIVTDGVIEARRHKRFFGPEGVVEAARRACGSDLVHMVEAVANAAVEFAGGRLTDDACILGARLADSDAACG